MNALTKVAAVVFLLIALVLGYMAVRLAMREPPPPPPPAVAEAPKVEEKTVPVVVANKAIAGGTKLTADMVRVDQWKVAPEVAVASTDSLIGKVLRETVSAGQPVGPYVLAIGLASHLEPGERAVTVPVDELAGAQNRIHPGDLIDVFLMMERNPEVPGSQTRLLQSRVKVLAYGRDSLDGPGEPENAGGGGSGNPAPVARNAMLAVPVAKVNELLLASRSGKLLMVLRSPEDEAVPDTTLFPARTPVLAVKPNLTPEQKAAAQEGVNMAYAGDGLPQLAGPPPMAETQPRPRPAASGGGGRSIEVLRGSTVQNVAY